MEISKEQIEKQAIEEMAKDVKSLDDVPYHPNCNYIYRRAEKLKSLGYIKQEWISVEERLPEDNQECLIFTKIHFVPDHVDDPDYYDGIEISRYFKGFGFGSPNGIYAKFWMPLPEPPKMKGD